LRANFIEKKEQKNHAELVNGKLQILQTLIRVNVLSIEPRRGLYGNDGSEMYTT
jgi:hypothetical protein